jgi:diadenosine tetraphosphate (Ap4A) HIT family hydrolase
MTDCPACQRIADIRAGTNPFFVAELSESFAVLHDHQAYEGWCVLLLKRHAEHLHLLPRDRQTRLAEDIARTAVAIARAVNPTRINYECLGNQLAHIHWHIIPRFRPPVDPDPRSAVWVRPASELQCGVDPVRRSRLVQTLRDALQR